MPLSDTDRMPFGAHCGKPMQDVPARYLHYLWTNGLKDEARTPNQIAVRDYIKESLSALRQDYPDGIW